MSNAFREIARNKPLPAPLEADPRKCYANGCPCRASVSVESGKFCCTSHAFVQSDRWPAVTHSLRESQWLIEFIDEVKAMDSRLEDWRAFASQFWTNQDEECMPHPQEEAVPYENRMRGEILYRCGLAKRPAVRLPAKPTRRFGNVADKAMEARA